MNTARVMEDGDLRLPPEVACKLNVKPGDSVGVELEPDGTIRMYPKKLRARDIAGMLSSKTDVKATTEEMDEAVAEAFRKGEL